MVITDFTRTVAICAIQAQLQEAYLRQTSDVAPHLSSSIQQYIDHLNKALDELFEIERKPVDV